MTMRVLHPMIILLFLQSLFMLTQSRSRSSSSSNNCHCYSYSGASENFNENGSCKYCSSCTNDSCKCLSEDGCETTWTIIGIVVAVLIIISLFVWWRQKRRRRLRAERMGVVGGMQPAVYQGNTQPMGAPAMQPAGYNTGNMYATTTQQPNVIVAQPQPAVVYVQQQPMNRQGSQVPMVQGQQQISNPTETFNADIDDQPPLYDEVPKDNM